MIRYSFETLDKAALFAAYLAIHSHNFGFTLDGYIVTITGGEVSPFTVRAASKIASLSESEAKNAFPQILGLLEYDFYAKRRMGA